MSQQLLITITTKDGASQTFRTVGASAKAMGTAIKSAADGAGGSLTKIGSESNKAAQGLNKLESEAKGAASAMGDLESKATKVGAALGTGLAALSRLGGQAETQRRQVDGLQRAYGDATDEILDFTEAIQRSTKFSNEDAREAAQIAATLAQNYGFTTDEIEKLIAVSADLAAIKGVSLAEAVQRTSAAMRGEAESAEFLGLTLNQAAIDREGLTLSMSNEEAAHFRLNALLEQAAYAEGAAGDAAETAAGQAAQFANSLQDIGTNIGAALGPVAGVTAGLADLALIMPVVGAGAGKALAGISKLATAAKASQGAMAALSIATGPVGIGLGLLAGAAGVVINAWQDNQAANAALADSYDGLAAAIAETMTATQQLAASDIRFDFGIQDQIDALGGDTIEQALGTDFQAYQRMLDETTLSTQEQAAANQMLAESFRAVADDGMNSLISAMNRLETQQENFTISGDLALTALEELNEALAYNGDGAEVVDAAVQRLNDAYAAGNITATEYAAGLTYLNDNMAEIVSGAQEAASATEELTQAQQDAARFAVEQGLQGQAERYEALARSIEKANEAALAPSLASGRGFGLMSEGEAEAFQAELDAVSQAQEEAAQRAIDTASALRDQLVPALDGASSGFAELARPGEDTLDVLDRIAPSVDNVGGSLLQLADGLNDAAQGMDAVLSTFSALDSLGSRSSGASDIASKLVGDPGAWSTIDDLVSNATISVEEYGAAVQAGYGIQSKDAEIQEQLNGIRAQQLPLLDRQMASYRAYIDRLGEASTAEQQQALYLQESANQAKVAASYSTAYAASLGEIPEDVATEIIANGAQADPVLKAILEDFGLIEVGADGEVRVNFPDAATLDTVTAAIDNLTETQIELFIAMSGGEIAEETVASLSDNLAEIDGRQATATATVEGQGADTIADTKEALDGIDGTTATATVEVEVDNSAIQAGLNSGAGFGATFDESIVVDIRANDMATPTINRVVTAASALAGLSGSVELTANDNASSVVSRAMQAVNAFDGLSGSATLSAEDNASSTIALVTADASRWDASTPTATLFAEDAATGAIALVQGDATAYATTYTATLSASDGASSVIGTAQGAASAFATDYAASLSAVDNASGTISSVAGQLANLDGSTATVYINAVDNTGGATARKLGGAIVPGAQLGRVVQVGEAGPEAVVLPYGSMVQPSPASAARVGQDAKAQKARKSLMPDVDMSEAYRKGGDSAKAFYDGLIDKAQARVAEARSALSSTIYGSEEEAQAALAEYQRFIDERERLKNKRGRAQGFDREQAQATRAAEKAAADVESTMADAGEEIAATGAEAGEAFSSELASGIDIGAAMEQIRALKDEFIQSMRSSAGAVGGVESAVASFNSEIDSITSGLKGASKATDTQTDKMSEDFGAVEESAADSGEAAGEELSAGIGAGAEDAQSSLESVSTELDAIGNAEIAPEVGADNKDALAGLKATGSELDDLDGANATVDVKVDDSEWQAFKDDVDAAQLGTVVTIKTKERSSEKKLGGAILADHVPAAALGRVVMVGEAGPEAVILPYGSMVTPSPASGARAAQEARGQGMNFYGSVTFIVPNADVAGAILAQATGVDRG